MKVKDLYWAARNSTFFINLESEGRPLLCEPRLSDEGGVRIRLWLRDPAGTGTGGAIALLSRDEAAVLANAIDTRRNWVGEKADDALPRIGVSATHLNTSFPRMQRIVCVAASSLRGTGKGPYLPKGTLMIWFVISIILLLFSAAVTGVALSNNVKGAGIGLIPGLVGLLLLIPACLYSVDVGEVAVIRNMGGSLAGHSEDAGFHWKTPWQSVIKYDTRNNLINFYKDTDYKYDGGSAVGKQVTVNDKSGASADIDVQVNYSLDPSAAEYLYSEYGKQQTFTQNYISNDLRSVAREQSGRFDTLTMLTNRGEYTKAVQDALAAKWKKIGLTVEQVSVQDVRYGEAITKKYTEAQAAEIDKQKALNEQQVAKTEAETKKIKAQGEADANAVLNESLTDNVLKQHYIDALSNADQLVVVPDGADTLVQTK